MSQRQTLEYVKMCTCDDEGNRRGFTTRMTRSCEVGAYELIAPGFAEASDTSGTALDDLPYGVLNFVVDTSGAAISSENMKRYP